MRHLHAGDLVCATTTLIWKVWTPRAKAVADDVNYAIENYPEGDEVDPSFATVLVHRSDAEDPTPKKLTNGEDVVIETWVFTVRIDPDLTFDEIAFLPTERRCFDRDRH